MRSFLLSGVFIVSILLMRIASVIRRGFPSLHLLVLFVSLQWFPRVCSPCGSFSCASSSSAFNAFLPGRILQLAFRFSYPLSFMPAFGVRRLPIAHMGLTTFFLLFLSLLLFFGDFPLLLTDVFLFSTFFSGQFFVTCGSPFVHCLRLVHCGLLLHMPSLRFICLARIFLWFSLFLTFVFDSFHIHASSSSLTRHSVIFIGCLCLAFPSGTFCFLSLS